MNLEELTRYKKLLKLEKLLCFGMSVLLCVGLSSHFKKNKDSKVDINRALSNNSLDLAILSESSILDFVKYDILDSDNFLKPLIKEDISLAVDELEDKKEDKDYGISEVVLDKTVDMALEKFAASLLESYDMSDEINRAIAPSYEEKMRIICERDGYTYEQLDAVGAGCVAESYGDGNCYDECYHIASVFYNRTHSNSYVYDVNKIFGNNAGYSIYYQFIAPGQFSVYINGTYKKYLGRIDLLGYKAAIDMFYSGIPSNNNLNFNNVPPISGSYVQYNPPAGNYFSRVQRPEDVIDDSVVRQRVMNN